MDLRKIARIWNKIWFEKESAAPFCAFRIFVGAITACCTLSDLLFSKVWFYEACPGSLNAVHIASGPDFRFCIFNFIPANETTVSLALFALLLSSVSLCFGLSTRLSALCTWLLRLSFYNQNIYVWNCGDALLQVCLLMMVLGPAANMYSIDAVIRRRAGEQPLPTIVEPWAQRLLQFQVALIYSCGFYYKRGNTWWDGTAVHYALNSYSYAQIHLAIFDSLWISRLASWGTLALELFLFTLIWFKPCRKWLLPAGILMHCAMFATMSIRALELLMIASYINFIEPRMVERFFCKFSSKNLTAKDAEKFAQLSPISESTHAK